MIEPRKPTTAQRVYDLLRESVLLMTIGEIAERMGVSTSAVRQAMRDLRRDGILRVRGSVAPLYWLTDNAARPQDRRGRKRKA